VPVENVRHEPKPAPDLSAAIARAPLGLPVAEEGSSGWNLASVGGDVAHDPSGTTTITFGSPPAAPSEATIARAPAPAAPAQSSAEHGGHGGHGGVGGGSGKAPDIDEIYEQVVERLERDALIERERRGGLLSDLPDLPS
jgi:hypothetical protein